MVRKVLMTTTCSAALVFGSTVASAADLLEEVKDSDQLSTFAEAIEAAELEDELEGDGPYTVFAPTDDAFDKLPDGVVDALMESENKEQLEKLLKAHIVEGEELTESDVEDEDDSKLEVEPMEGDEVTIDASGDEVRIEVAGRSDGDDESVDLEEPPSGGTDQPSTGMAGQQPSTGTTQQPQSGTTGQPSTGGGMAERPSADPAQPETPGAGADQPSRAIASPNGGDDIGSGEAKVVEADIEADNGVIHAIDAVLVSDDLREELREIKDKG